MLRKLTLHILLLSLAASLSCKQFGCDSRFKADPAKLAKAEINRKIAENLDKAEKATDDNERARFQGIASELLCEKGDYARALAAAQLGVRANPTQIQSLASIAESSIIQGRYAEAIATLQDLISRESNYARAHFLLGNAYYGSGDNSKAEQAWRRALEIDPMHVRATGNLASVMVKSGRAAQGLELLKAAIEKQPETAGIYKAAGIAAERAGKKDDAKAYYTEYLRRVPDAEDRAVVSSWLSALN